MVAVVLEPYSEDWPVRFERERDRLVAALGDLALAVDHVGSTSVPGLAAKPVIDICLIVPDTIVESSYVPALDAAGFEFLLREPEWFEHRLLRREEPRVNLHVFPPDCAEVTRMLAFRDHLRSDVADRDRYETTKRELAERDWPTMQHYADAKTDVIADIMVRALAGRRDLQ